MKPWNCSGCGKPISVDDDYEEQGCCDGRECGCLGMAINPVFCEECEDELKKTYLFGSEGL